MPDQRKGQAWYLTDGTDWYYVAPIAHALEKITHEVDGTVAVVVLPPDRSYDAYLRGIDRIRDDLPPSFVPLTRGQFDEYSRR